MPDKVIGSTAEAGKSVPAPAPQNSPRPVRTAVPHDDGITNPRDGRGPLRRRDDQSAKLPLRPPH